MPGAVSSEERQTDGETNAIRFNWAFGAWVKTDGGRKLISVDRDMSLNTGDRLKLFLQPLSACHIYLIYHGSRDEVHLLFPTGRQASLMDQDLDAPQLIPEGSGWFSIDSHAGLERFYLLASLEPLPELETLLARLKGATARERQDLAQEIRSEIMRLKKRHRNLQAAAERPVTIGGIVRGADPDTPAAAPDVRQLAREITAAAFFSRTFSIAHE